MTVKERIKAINKKWDELESLGYRSGGCGNNIGRTAIVKGDYPNGKIVGYLNKDLSIDWIND